MLERKRYSRRKVTSNAYRYEIEEDTAARDYTAERSSRAPSLKELLENAGTWSLIISERNLLRVNV